MAWQTYERIYGWGPVAAKLAAARAQYDRRSGADPVYWLPNLSRWVQVHNAGRDQNGPFELTLHTQCPCGG